MLNWNLHSSQLLEIIQVLDSISWVRCDSGNVFLKRCNVFIQGTIAIGGFSIVMPPSEHHH